MKKFFKVFFGEDVKLEKKIYYGCSTMVILNSVILFILNLFNNLSGLSVTVTVLCTVGMMVITHFGFRSEDFGLWSFITVMTFNLFITPISFFAYGGIRSGMILYLLIGLFIVAVVLRGRPRLTAAVISFTLDIAVIIFGYIHPEYITVKSEANHFNDLIICFMITGTYILVNSVVLINHFMKQRAKYECLLVELKRLSNEESLTKLYNRRYIIDKAETELVGRSDVCAVMIDIDDFKEYNDRNGHQFGDMVLIKIARCIADAFGYENVCRYGGEEFLAIMSGKAADEVKAMAEKLRNDIKTLGCSKEGSGITVSIGVAQKGERTVYETISAADKQLYTAKSCGKNKIACCF